jgi:hypothetical protein
MTSAPVVDLQVWGVRRVAPALGRMATGRRQLRGTPGLRFAKLLGTGSGASFTPRDADPHHWGLLTVWQDVAAADAGPDPRLLSGWDDAAYERLRLRLRPLSSRGQWSGTEPFGSPTDGPYAGPVVALTRARLRAARAASFWRAVPPVVSSLTSAPGLRLAFGVGEAPVLLQGTFSLWESSQHLVDFAYRSQAHLDAVARTGPARWYSEELFARFAVTDVAGSYRGWTP